MLTNKFLREENAINAEKKGFHKLKGNGGEAVFCYNCGSMIRAGAHFCHYCGAKVKRQKNV